MKDLVDALYYDYVLHKLVCLYTSDNKNEEIAHYQKIAQRLLVKLRAEKAVFDAEVGLKFAYIKLHDLHLSHTKCIGRLQTSCCRKHYAQFLATAYDYLCKIMPEYPMLAECDAFKRLSRLVASLFIFSFPTLAAFRSLDGVEGSQPAEAYLRQQGIEISTEDEFRIQKDALLKPSEAAPERLNASLECMMGQLKTIFLSFNIPALQFFATRKAIQLREVYPNIFEGTESIPTSAHAYDEEIVNSYLELRSSLSKARGVFISPKDKGERVGWESKA